MADKIQHLIDQIQKEGVDTAIQKAEKIIADANQQAEELIANAEKECAEKRAAAEVDAAALTERSIKTIKQAGRDLLILLGQSCEKVVSSSLQHSVEQALSTDLLKDLIKKSTSVESGSIEITVNESEVKALTAYCAELASESGKEISLAGHSEVLSGFTLGFKDKNVYLDFTGEAIADALAAFLRPELAKLVNDAIREPAADA
jgi:V/A-type H+-transporting ATPase subunit E